MAGGTLRMKSLQELEALAKSDPSQLVQELVQTQEKLLQAQAEIQELKRQLFGRKSDQLTPEQESMLNEIKEDIDEQTQRNDPLSLELLEEETKEPAPKRKRGRRHPMPEHLEREVVVLEPEPLPICANCGLPFKRIGEETTEELEYIPAKIVVRQVIRPKYGCGCGCGGVCLAPLPPRLLPQSKLGLGLAVHLLLSRFDDHVSYYSLERIFRERHGVIIPRQQMVQWVFHIATLLYQLWLLLFQSMKKSGYLQIDETPVKVLDPEVKGKAATGFLWFYSVPGGDVWLDFQDTRGKKAPHEKLLDFKGTIQTDAYGVYDSLKNTLESLKRIGCTAHSRRKFYTALTAKHPEAVWFIAQFRKLYAIERQAKGLSPQERRALRLKKAAPIWKEMKQKALALQAKTLPGDYMGKALSYFINEYQALVGYLKNGVFEIDNNLVEVSIKSPVIGRKRWLFIGHPDAGWRSAVIYSFIISCRRRGINPQEYLTDILSRLPSMNITQISELLPANWKPVPKPT